MNSHNNLPMHEEILLLALNDDKGTTSMGSMFANAMGGAILAELVMSKTIAISEDKHRKVTILSPALTGDSILDQCLQKIRDEKKAKKASDWVMKFASLKDLKNRTARSLVAKGILSESQDKVLGLFKRTIFPEATSGPEEQLRQRLHEVIFWDSNDPDARTVVVIALTNASQMLSGLFDKKDLKGRKARIKQLSSGEIVGQATKEAVEAIQMAIILTTIIVPVVITSAN